MGNAGPIEPAAQKSVDAAFDDWASSKLSPVANKPSTLALAQDVAGFLDDESTRPAEAEIDTVLEEEHEAAFDEALVSWQEA
jgi:hypothetical protein